MSATAIPKAFEDLLNKLEKYLRDVLSKEKLSYAAEKQRKSFVEQIEVVKLPPSLPPLRKDNKSPHSVLKVTSTKDSKDLPNTDDNLLYEDPTESGYNPGIPEDNYLEPSGVGFNRETVADDSGTDFENDSDDEDGNNNTDGLRRGSVPLPIQNEEGCNQYMSMDGMSPVKAQQEGKRGDLPLCQLSNILHMGEVFQRTGLLNKQLTRNFCALSEDKLIVYKSKDDSRPISQIPLIGCEVTYVEKDGRFQNVLRINQTGVENHWFSTTTKKNAGIWLQYLKSVSAGKGPPDKIDRDYLDTIDATSDEGLGTSLRQSSSSDTTTPSSAEGSGDGVITSTGPQATPVGTDKGNKGSGILGYLRNVTISKKDKMAQQLKEVDGEEVFRRDPAVKIADHAKVKCERLLRNKKWNKFFCVVRNRSIECYKNLESFDPDVSFSLNGVTIESANLPNHELALKLIQDQTVLMIELNSRSEHGNWLSVLVKESGCGSPLTKMSPLSDDGGEIYEVVKDFEPAQQSKVAAHGGSSEKTPPPLPRNPPPMRTPPNVKRSLGSNVPIEDDEEDSDDSMVYEKMLNKDKQDGDRGGGDIEADTYSILTGEPTLYDDMYDDTLIEPKKSSKETPPKKQVGELIGRIKNNLQKESTSRVREEAEKSDTKNSGVIACATGPTIAEDKELLEKTSNPLLSELRKSKMGISKENNEVVNQVSALKGEILLLKKKRNSLSTKKSETRNPTQKKAMEKEMQDVEAKLDEKQKELTKLQVVVQEQSPGVRRNSSFGKSNNTSPNVSRNGSFNSGKFSPADSPRGSFSSTKSATLPVITSKYKTEAKLSHGSEKKTDKKFTSSWQSDRARSPGTKTAAKSTESSVKKSELKVQVGKTSITSSGRKPGQTSGSSSSQKPVQMTETNSSQHQAQNSGKVKQTTSLDNIPKVKDRMKMFESNNADSSKS